MGFFGKDDDTRWVDNDDLKWSPESPLFYGKGFSTDESLGNFAPSRPDDEVRAPAPSPPSAKRLWLPRIAIGLAQGVGLFALTQSRALNLWPGNDGYLFAALSLAGLFAPLLLIEGLGDIPIALLALWTAIAATALGCLGLYHHWRIEDGDPSHAGMALIALLAIALVIAQALLRAGVRDRKILASYRSCFDVTWTLAARLLVWAAVTGTAWAVLGSGNSAMNWLRLHYPDFHPALDPSRLTLPLVGIAGAAGFALTAGNSWTRRLTRKALLACFTITLPVAIAGAIALIAAQLFWMQQPLWAFLSCATLLLIAFNASYRGGARRGGWRRICEITAAFALAALGVFAAIALHTRVTDMGWTPMRIYAALAVAFLGAYGLLYCFAGLIGIGGGRWMQRVEIANRGLAIVLLASCLLLCTPLADPLQLSVKAQAARLADGADPAAFDFAWLKREGAHFGREALMQMQASSSPEVARDAAVTLATPPVQTPHPPARSAPISPCARPARACPKPCCERDWSKVPAVPPCLTRARAAL